MSTAAQRRRYATENLESASAGLLYFAETYAQTDGNRAYHQSKRLELFQLARTYAAAVRNLARLRA